MTDRPVAAVPGGSKVPVIPGRLEPDAIGTLQDTVIGIANTGPAVSVGLSLAALAAAAAYASAPVIVLCGVPMLIIANAYRRLNLWNANCGASFEWVGRAINPYLGFLTGWLILAANLVGNVAAVVVLAPSVLAIFGSSANSTWPNIAVPRSTHTSDMRDRSRRACGSTCSPMCSTSSINATRPRST